MKEAAAFFGLWIGSCIVLIGLVVGLLWLFLNAPAWAWTVVVVLFLLCVAASWWGLSE